jgi:hypothetical protein
MTIYQIRDGLEAKMGPKERTFHREKVGSRR